MLKGTELASYLTYKHPPVSLFLIHLKLRKNIMKKFLTTTITCLLIFLVSEIQSQTANLSIQGVLRTSEGDAVENGDYDLTFKLYTAAATGNPLWEETIKEVTVKGGIYSVILGSGSTPLDAAFDQPYFLGVSVEGGTEMIPRAKLTSSPYALSLIGDDNVFPNSGNVGVGSASPQSKLTIARGNGTLGLDAEESADNSAVISTKSDGLEFSTEGVNNGYYFAGESVEVMRVKKDGMVGIGTDDPQHPLHIVGDDDQLKIEGTNHAKLTFSKLTTNASIGFDANNGNDLILANPNNDLRLNASGISLNPSNTVQINKDGEALQLVGTDSVTLAFYPQGTGGTSSASIGFNDREDSDDFSIVTYGGDLRLNTNDGRVLVDKQLEVAIDNESFDFYVGYHRWVDNNGIYAGDPWTSKAGIISYKTIVAPVFRTFSDQRIKKDFEASNAALDLETLLKIEVTDYRHKDVISYGNEHRKGLIAQQIKSVFPEAISLVKGYIPNIYHYSSNIELHGEKTMITLEEPHGLSIGDKVKIMADGGVEELIVDQVNDAFSFAVEPKEIQMKENVFVYGKEVGDLHSVDYDRVFTLAVSATQELARKVEALEKENAALHLRVKKGQKEKDSFSAQIIQMNDRLKAVESLFKATSSN